MRIIAGTHKNRTIQEPRLKPHERMTEMAREALFNIVGAAVVGVRFADLFAGSGIVGIEALSRGAAQVTFVERKRPFVKQLRNNLAHLSIGADQARVWENDTFLLPESDNIWAQWDMVFLDPPLQMKDDFLDILVRREILRPHQLIIVHRPIDRAGQLKWSELELLDQRSYGKSALFFYSVSTVSC